MRLSDCAYPPRGHADGLRVRLSAGFAADVSLLDQLDQVTESQ